MIQPVTSSVKSTSFGSISNFQGGITSSSIGVRDSRQVIDLQNADTIKRQDQAIQNALRAQQTTGARLNYVI